LTQLLTAARIFPFLPKSILNPAQKIKCNVQQGGTCFGSDQRLAAISKGTVTNLRKQAARLNIMFAPADLILADRPAHRPDSVADALQTRTGAARPAAFAGSAASLCGCAVAPLHFFNFFTLAIQAVPVL
jgi:hypothetical protein